MHERPKLPDLALFHERGKQAEAEVVPSSSLIEVEVEVWVKVEVGVCNLDVLQMQFSNRDGAFTTYMGGWVGGSEIGE